MNDELDELNEKRLKQVEQLKEFEEAEYVFAKMLVVTQLLRLLIKSRGPTLKGKLSRGKRLSIKDIKRDMWSNRWDYENA